MAALIDRPVDGLQSIEGFLADWLDLNVTKPFVQNVWWLFKGDRKDAEAVNGEFLDWLTQRRLPERPFFAFLNFYDAHSPYQLPTNGIHRFGGKPRNNREADLIKDWMSLTARQPSDQQIALARDAYDDCVADLDERLGRLIDEFERRGTFERTWVIITADHGESFGEHPGVFRLGTSLYETEIHVPLLVIPPSPNASRGVVPNLASLRDVPATIVDIVDDLHPPRRRCSRGTVPMARRHQGNAQPGRGPGKAAHCRENEESDGPSHGRATHAGTVPAMIGFGTGEVRQYSSISGVAQPTDCRVRYTEYRFGL